jgi:hypothetical protein
MSFLNFDMKWLKNAKRISFSNTIEIYIKC